MNIIKDKGIICLYFMKYIAIVSFITFCLSCFFTPFLSFFLRKLQRRSMKQEQEVIRVK